MTPDEALRAFLIERFEVLELRRFIESLEAGLTAELPGAGTPLIEQANAAIDLLKRRGYIDHDFFDRLLDDRPVFKDSIGRLRAQFVVQGALRPGEKWLGGGHELIERVGGGGFAHVWKARDLITGRSVALKIFHEDRANDPAARQRFLRGAETLKENEHKNLVKVRSAYQREGGTIYFVMEFIKGQRLDELVQAKTKLDVLIGYVLQVGDALEYLHSRHFLHRDVKPSNIMITADGEAKLIDLDLVASDLYDDITRGAIGGTPGYAPPEAFHSHHGAPPKFGPAFDVYSLAQTAAFVISRGELPIQGQRSEKQIECSDDVRSVLAAALYDDPAARTPTVASFCAELRRAYFPDLPVANSVAPPPLRSPRLPLKVRLHRIAYALRQRARLLLGLTLGFSIGASVLYTLLRPHRLLDTKPYDQSGPYVPVEGCARLEIKAWGGGGGSTAHPGGGGGFVGASFAISDRSAFDIDVGTGGGSWRVGGGGRLGGAEAGAGYFAGARGGGYTGVRQGARNLLIAGGGGGAGGAGAGGGGGGQVGEAGHPNDRGGDGGTQSAGGLGGGHIGDGGDGMRGEWNVGGVGGTANPERGGGGGGGGGGYYGGGGGGADNLYMLRINAKVPDAGSGGGGGGSGWYDPQAILPGTAITLTAQGAVPANHDDPDYAAPSGEGGTGTGPTGQQKPRANGSSGRVVIKCWD